MEEKYLTDEEFIAHINHCIDSYSGDISLMNDAVGLLVVGRVMGWEHQRIISSRSSWSFATKVFGDPKKFMPKRTAIGVRKSVALSLVDTLTSAGQLLSGYLDIVRGHFHIPKEDRRRVFD